VTQIKKIFWISLVLKLALAAALPLTNDEAYYWVWSQRMQLSFFDHPPFVAWLMWLGQPLRALTGLAGSVRWPAVLMGQATVYIWLIILQPYLTTPQITYFLLLSLLSPLVGGSALLVTPDLPLMFFFATAVFCFARWLSRPTMGMALAIGLALGLGLSSKYMMVLFGLSLLPYVLMQNSLRGAFLRHLPILLFGLLLGAMPVLLWNFLNDFASYRFQVQHGLGGRAWKPSWTYEYALVQTFLVFPVVLYWAYRSRCRLPSFFHFLAWTPLVFFLFTTYRGYVEGNWPIMAYPPLFALAVSFYPINVRGLKLTLAFWASGIVLLMGMVWLQPEFARTSKLREFHQFDALVAQLRETPTFYARSYQMASRLHFELGQPVYKLKGMNRTDFYDFLPNSQPGSGQTYLLVVEKNDRLPDFYAQRGDRVVRVTPLSEGFELWQVQAP